MLEPKSTLGVVTPLVHGTPYADEDMASMSLDSRKNWNNPDLEFITQKDRQVVDLWDGENDAHRITVAYDHVVTDPAETGDGITGVRRQRRTMRSEVEPINVPGTDWYESNFHGQKSYFCEALATNKTPAAILDERTWSTSALVFRAWIMYHEEQNLDQEFMGIHYSPLSGTGAPPSVADVAQVGGTEVAARHIHGVGRDVVVIFNRNPAVPLTGQIEVASDIAIAANTEVVLVGASTSVLRSATRSGNNVTISVGAGTGANQARVWRGVAA